MTNNLFTTKIWMGSVNVIVCSVFDLMIYFNTKQTANNDLNKIIRVSGVTVITLPSIWIPA